MGREGLSSHWVTGFILRTEKGGGAKWPGREAAQSPPTSAKDKNEWRYTCPSHIRLHGVGRDNCSFTFIFTSYYPCSLHLDTKRAWQVRPGTLYPRAKRPRHPLDRMLRGPLSRSECFGEGKISCLCQESNHISSDSPLVAGPLRRPIYPDQCNTVYPFCILD